MKGRMQKQIGALQIWDDGEHNDRYTVVWPDGDYLSMGIHPLNVN